MEERLENNVERENSNRDLNKMRDGKLIFGMGMILAGVFGIIYDGEFATGMNYTSGILSGVGVYHYLVGKYGKVN